jgi:hypothetical protein
MIMKRRVARSLNREQEISWKGRGTADVYDLWPFGTLLMSIVMSQSA